MHVKMCGILVSILLVGVPEHAYANRMEGPSPAVQGHTNTLLLAQACHPSYQGECVPITSDADCASGSGNGPAYVNGPVRVVGPDEYGLDRDGDGVACER